MTSLSNGKGTFDPSLGFITGTITITYTITDQFGNPQTASKDVLIKPAPVLSIDGLQPQYCLDAAPDTLIATVNIPGGAVNFSGPGVSSVVVNGVTKYVFKPALAGASALGFPHRVKLVYTTPAGCTDSTFKFTTVYALPVVAFAFNAKEYCLNAPSIDLNKLVSGDATFNPANGQFDNTPGVVSSASGPVFIPAVAGEGLQSITYRYTDPSTGCSKAITRNITVRPIPKTNFQTDRNCNKLTATFKDLTTLNQTLGDTLVAWNWSFGDGTNNSLRNPTHTFPSPGNYAVNLLVQTNKGCSKDTTINISIGTIPIPAFTWTNNLRSGYHPNPTSGRYCNQVCRFIPPAPAAQWKPVRQNPELGMGFRRPGFCWKCTDHH